MLRTGSTLNGTVATVSVGASGTVQNGADAAAAGRIVNLAAVIYILAKEVVIDKDINIRGTGANSMTVSGNNTVRVFNVINQNVTLDGISIVNRAFSRVRNTKRVFEKSGWM